MLLTPLRSTLFPYTTLFRSGLGEADQALYRGVLLHRRLALRRLLARQIDRRIELRTRHAQRCRGKAHAVDRIGRDLVERALLAQSLWLIATGCEFLGDEQVVDGIGIGAGAAQPNHVPDVVQRGAREREQDGADFRRAVRLFARRAVGLGDADMGAEPVGLADAGSEFPARVGAVAAGLGADV